MLARRTQRMIVTSQGAKIPVYQDINAVEYLISFSGEEVMIVVQEKSPNGLGDPVLPSFHL